MNGNWVESENSRILVVGPVPPPVHGQSMVTQAVVDYMRESELTHAIDVLDTGQANHRGVVAGLRRLRGFVRAMKRSAGAEAVYLSANSGRGIWMSVAIAKRVRTGVPLFIHYHSNANLNVNNRGIRALSRAAGSQAVHVVLSPLMAARLTIASGSPLETLVLNNSVMVDRRLSQIELPRSSGRIVLAHLSNLSKEKGLGDFLELCLRVADEDPNARFLVGGPVRDPWTRTSLAAAQAALGQRLRILGPLDPDQKLQFFKEATHFVFPSNYVNEAEPLVIYEALAAGVICLATDVGYIQEQLDGRGGVAVAKDRDFVESALEYLSEEKDLDRLSVAARGRYLDALSESIAGLEHLVRRLSRKG